MEVLVYASTRDKEIIAKTVEVLVFASMREKEVNAKTVREKGTRFSKFSFIKFDYSKTNTTL